MKLIIQLCLYLASNLFCFGAFAQSATPSYTIGVVPQFNTLQTQEIWQPILKELETRTGFKLQLYGASSIGSFEDEFQNGHYDFAYMNPYHAVIAAKTQGYIPLLRDQGEALFGILVVQNDSPYQTINDLDNKLLALPSPNALGASLMIQADLNDIFKVKMQPVYVKSHDSVYLNVALGITDAGGGVQKTLQEQSPEIRKQLRTLYQTQKVISHPLVVHPRVPSEDQQKLQQAMLDLSQTEVGKKLISQIPIKHLVSTTIADYQSISNMNLERFVQKKAMTNNNSDK